MKISVGITSFNRVELLSTCIKSIIENNPNEEIEILIGNDYVQLELNQEMLKISDNRIKIFNYSKNLGEIKNLNNLVQLATGDYFIWMADDDEFHPYCFKNVFPILKGNSEIDLLVPLTFSGTTLQELNLNYDKSLTQINKAEFLQKYINEQISVQSVYMFFKLSFLKNQLIGFEELTPNNLFYSDVAFMIKAITLSSNPYFYNFPCALFRIHPQSRSESTADVYKHLIAQRALSNLIAKKYILDKTIAKKIISNLYISKFSGHYITLEARNLECKIELNVIVKNFILFQKNIFNLIKYIGFISYLELELKIANKEGILLFKILLKKVFYKTSKLIVN